MFIIFIPLAGSAMDPGRLIYIYIYIDILFDIHILTVNELLIWGLCIMIASSPAKPTVFWEIPGEISEKMCEKKTVGFSSWQNLEKNKDKHMI